MNIIKRDRTEEAFDISKVANAIRRAFVSTGEKAVEKSINKLCKKIEAKLEVLPKVDVEAIQDLVEEALMSEGYFKVAKSYILYREKRSEYRTVINKFCETITDKSIISAL